MVENMGLFQRRVRHAFALAMAPRAFSASATVVNFAEAGTKTRQTLGQDYVGKGTGLTVSPGKFSNDPGGSVVSGAGGDNDLATPLSRSDEPLDSGRVLIIDMLPHDRQQYQQEMGHVWMGFSEEQVARHLDGAGFGAMRFRALAPDASAKGPALFAATARRLPGPKR